MIPLLTLSEMRDADARAVAQRGQDALVRDAGTAVGLCAQQLLGQCYGRRVCVVAGPGLNGADGRVAARWLISRGALVRVLEWNQLPALLEGYDLVVDAAFGTGLSRPFLAPKIARDTLVLAVDLPSGVDTDSGEILGEPMVATATIALGAFKPAHFTGPSVEYVGELHFAGLSIATTTRDGLVDDEDLTSLISSNVDDHKWGHAVQAFVGSTLMPGAAELVLRGALAGGASMIRLVSRGDVATQVRVPPEVVHLGESAVDPRCKAVVAGPGLGPNAPAWLREGLSRSPCPVVLDADGLDRAFIEECAPHDASWVLTPHAGEFERLAGHAVTLDRIDDVRLLAHETGCVVLLKGPRTFVAHPNGALHIVTSGTTSLATAGTGDVLAGLIAATIARGHEPFRAAALAAHLHGRAGATLAPYATASEVATSIRTLVGRLPRP
jgi:ADP-dependent NAD(P)H-hydrate dehydratase / NAD(P)H-hydrate epimerase